MSISSPRLRLAKASDVGAILPLFRAYQACYSELTGASEEKTRAFLVELIANPQQGFAVVAEADERVIGFATGFVTVSGILADRLIHLGDVYVDGPFRRRGVGTALMDAVSEQARVRGLGLVRWLSLASNTELNRWYEALGAKGGDFRLFLRPVKPDAGQNP